MNAVKTRINFIRSGRARYAVPAVILAIFLVALGRAAAQDVIPTFTIQDVVVNETVTIETRNFPPGQDFVVTMGHMGTLGIDGIPVGVTNSGLGGTLTATYVIPNSLKGLERIAIRLESAQGFFAYNWFYNDLTPAPPTPTFAIESVDPNVSVTIRTRNFPPDRVFIVTMGHMGTLGIDGIPVGTIDSGPEGGTIVATFDIPNQLKGLERIAIRAQSTPFFAYNWFDNAIFPAVIPTFRVCAVVEDASVTIRTDPTFMPNTDYTVLMNFMGTHGENGYVVGGFTTGPDGVVTAEFPIPTGLRGLDQIAIRAEQANGPYFSYNYFDNVTAIYCQ